ncbi:MAG: hypothetical protein ACL7BU_03785 [Candidatus Phlomobacter fragariae]
MSAWCNYKGFEGAAVFLKTYPQEEMRHIVYLIILVILAKCPILCQIDSSLGEFNSVKEVFEKTYQHE